MRFSSRSIAAVVAAAAIAVPGAAVADSARHADVPRHDAKIVSPISAQVFLPAAAQGNRFEIVTGQLAQQRAESNEVRALGAMFVTDHTRLLQQGSAVAAELGVTLPEGLSPQQQAIVDRLARLSGRSFDAAWTAAQIAAHKQALWLHLRAAIRGEQPQIRTLAQGALPIITHHLGELLDLAAAGHDHGDDHGERDHHHGDGDRHDRGHRHHGHEDRHRNDSRAFR